MSANHGMLDIQPLSPRWGTIVRPREPMKLPDVPRDEIIRLLKESGTVVFQRFEATAEDVRVFSEQYASRFVQNLHAGQNREMVADDGKTATVNLGKQLVGHHAELAYSPLRPDLLWFHCVTPAARGGETFVCDGIELWEKMSASLKKRFADDITYKFPRSKDDLWPLMTGKYEDRASTCAALDAVGVKHHANDDGTMDLEYRVPAAKPARWAPGVSFANSVVVHGTPQEPGTFLADGSPVTNDMKRELLLVASELSVNVQWNAGDVVMVDNTRMMHGRMPFTDPARKILVRMGYASFD